MNRDCKTPPAWQHDPREKIGARRTGKPNQQRNPLNYMTIRSPSRTRRDSRQKAPHPPPLKETSRKGPGKNRISHQAHGTHTREVHHLGATESRTTTDGPKTYTEKGGLTPQQNNATLVADKEHIRARNDSHRSPEKWHFFKANKTRKWGWTCSLPKKSPNISVIAFRHILGRVEQCSVPSWSWTCSLPK